MKHIIQYLDQYTKPFKTIARAVTKLFKVSSCGILCSVKKTKHCQKLLSEEYSKTTARLCLTCHSYQTEILQGLYLLKTNSAVTSRAVKNLFTIRGRQLTLKDGDLGIANLIKIELNRHNYVCIKIIKNVINHDYSNIPVATNHD